MSEPLGCRSLNESKQELRIVSNERDKLKADVQTIEYDVAEFFKRCDHAIWAELTTKAFEEATEQKNGLTEKVVELENAMDSLKVENSQLKEENLKLESIKEVVKAGVENLWNQFEARQVLAKIKEMHHSLDLSMIEVNYPVPKEVGNETAQSPPEA
ncbi:hypothetical protein Fot_28961 [Forsythia ovata]|uniref:Uncharacterized protein n=1 Tax=Forsythia ovata TaxID=205694 RepID=A0ABD1TQH7_9LAMI